MTRASSTPRARTTTEPMPSRIEPMLAVLSCLPDDQSGYAFEFKWDGVRALCYLNERSLLLRSRNQIEITQRYPELHELAEAIGRRSAILDGEVVAFDEADRPSFAQLQRRMHVDNPHALPRLMREVPVHYLLFDLLYLDEHSTMRLPFVQRRKRLEALTLAGPHWRVSPMVIAEGNALYETAQHLELEGIVAKRLDGVYEPGRRSSSWLKIKIVQSQEFVIGGWVPEGGANVQRVGTLLIGYYEPILGKGKGRLGRQLRFAGGVGTGFDAATHRRLTDLLRRLARASSPFADVVPRKEARFVEPTLVAQVEYRRWPEGGMVQQAAFKGLREDKQAVDVVKEERICPAALKKIVR